MSSLLERILITRYTVHIVLYDIIFISWDYFLLMGIILK